MSEARTATSKFDDWLDEWHYDLIKALIPQFVVDNGRRHPVNPFFTESE
jgi:hypothetical protein